MSLLIVDLSRVAMERYQDVPLEEFDVAHCDRHLLSLYTVGIMDFVIIMDRANQRFKILKSRADPKRVPTGVFEYFEYSNFMDEIDNWLEQPYET